MRIASSLAAILAISACASAQPSTTPYAGANVDRERRTSWMSPSATNSALLYVSDAGTNDVHVFALPKGTRVGKLTGFHQPQGECSDAAGNVFITDTQRSEIVEYAHAGTTPLQVFHDTGFEPVGCSVDPTTGNLAVTEIFATGGAAGDVAIYKDASGAPARYTDATFYYYYFCGFDRRGNLYVDGYSASNAVVFAALDAGSASLTNVVLDQTINVPGMVQWDGKYVAVGDQNYDGRNQSGIYDFRIKGTIGYLEFRTPLAASNDVVQAWIDGRTVYAPDAGLSAVGFYHYRAGDLFNSISGLQTPIGATVSSVATELR